MDHLSASSYTGVTNFKKCAVFIGPPCIYMFTYCMFYAAIYLLTESKSDMSKVCVRPASLSDQRQSTFYRRSNTSSASADERFHCDITAVCDSNDNSDFTFNFTTDVAYCKPDSEIDTATSSGTNQLTSSVTDSSVSRMDKTSSVKHMTAPRTTNTLCFNTSTAGTPFLFNFESS